MELKVHKFIEGPYNSYEAGLTNKEDEYFFAECLVEIDEEIHEMSICSFEYDDIYKIWSHLKSPTVEPYVIKEEPNDQ